VSSISNQEGHEDMLGNTNGQVRATRAALASFVLLVLFMVNAVAQELTKPDAKAAETRRAQLLAPDGIPYDNEGSLQATEMKALSANLVSNGSFEAGRYWPFQWQATDGLTTFWIEGGTDGSRCIRIYTDVLEAQWKDREERVRGAVQAAAAKAGGDPQSLPADPVPAPPERIPTNPPYYDTVAALHGVHYRSDYINCLPGAVYRFSIDARTEAEGEPKVFIKGFFDQTVDTRDGPRVIRRDAYQAPIFLNPCDGQWRRYARRLRPWQSKTKLGGKPLKPQWLQVQIYAYWKPGNYYFDNVRLEIVAMEEPEPETSERPPKQNAPKGPEQSPKTPARQEEEFPVFKP